MRRKHFDWAPRRCHAGFMDRSELIELVRSIMSGELGEAGTARALKQLDAAVTHRETSGLIYWPTLHGLPDEPTPEQVVDAALAHRPVILGARPDRPPERPS